MSGPRPPRYTQPTMPLSPDEARDLGRAVVADGRLKALRQRLGVTRTAMSELLYTNVMSYTDWEKRPGVNLRTATAERVGRFYQTAVGQLDLLDEFGLSSGELVPLYTAATTLGIPNELLFQWYREGRFEAVDAGILGLWVHRSDIAQLRDKR